MFVGVNERVRIFMQTFQEEPHHKRTSISLNYALLGSSVSSLDHVELLTLTKTLVCVVKETVMLNHIMYCGPSSAGNNTVKLTDHYLYTLVSFNPPSLAQLNAKKPVV